MTDRRDQVDACTPEFEMDWNRVEGNWKKVKGKVKEKWGNLTDDDLTAKTVSEISLRARSRNATDELRRY